MFYKKIILGYFKLLSASCLAGVVGVCGWLADGYHYSQDKFGGKLKPVSAFCVTGGKYPPLEGCMLYFYDGAL